MSEHSEAIIAILLERLGGRQVIEPDDWRDNDGKHVMHREAEEGHVLELIEGRPKVSYAGFNGDSYK